VNKRRKVFTIDVTNLTKADIEYFRQKLANALIYDPTTAADKARRQLELIEDAAVIYKITHKERKDD
jgi:hypothetical protein